MWPHFWKMLRTPVVGLKVSAYFSVTYFFCDEFFRRKIIMFFWISVGNCINFFMRTPNSKFYWNLSAVLRCNHAGWRDWRPCCGSFMHGTRSMKEAHQFGVGGKELGKTKERRCSNFFTHRFAVWRIQGTCSAYAFNYAVVSANMANDRITLMES